MMCHAKQKSETDMQNFIKLKHYLEISNCHENLGDMILVSEVMQDETGNTDLGEPFIRLFNT